jgi:hypothetical protein
LREGDGLGRRVRSGRRRRRRQHDVVCAPGQVCATSSDATRNGSALSAWSRTTATSPPTARQLDTDKDGMGNACDSDDDDGDGVDDNVCAPRVDLRRQHLRSTKSDLCVAKGQLSSRGEPGSEGYRQRTASATRASTHYGAALRREGQLPAKSPDQGGSGRRRRRRRRDTDDCAAAANADQVRYGRRRQRTMSATTLPKRRPNAPIRPTTLPIWQRAMSAMALP